MNYAILAEDRPDSLRARLAARPEHLTRLERLKEQGRLILAGPHPAIDSENPDEAGFSGSLIIAQFESLEAAERWANDDPYLVSGVYERVQVKPLKIVLP